MHSGCRNSASWSRSLAHPPLLVVSTCSWVWKLHCELQLMCKCVGVMFFTLLNLQSMLIITQRLFFP
jgi:hypothetical protein